MKQTPLALITAASVSFHAVAVAAAQQKTFVKGGDWTLIAEPGTKAVALTHARLGLVLTNIQLWVRAGGEEEKITDWTAEQKQPDRLLIRTTEPRSVWSLQLTKDDLRISCTAASAVLRAEVPVSEDRVLARLMDPDGFPVEWSGTGEVAGSYGGSTTRNPSHLPVKNPDCMYFALGSVAGGPFHSLFDRSTDTAIDCPEAGRFEIGTNPQILQFEMPLSGSAEIRIIPDYFTKTLGVPFYAKFNEGTFPRAPMVWCSWTSYYGDVTEAAMVTNADWLADNLKPYGFQYVQLDDGYDRGSQNGHFWVEHWDDKRFPHGPQWLTSYIRSKGLHAGLWLVPNAYAGELETHPQWYLRDKQGKIVQDYGTPALDSSNPEVLDWLRKLFSTLRDWGFDYFKFDGEHAMPRYVPAVDRQKLFDSETDPITVYRRRLEVIRETIGSHTFVEGCPAGTPLNGPGFFNSYFNGDDVYNNWNGMHALFSSINANAFLNRMLFYVMPGEGMELGERITVEQARQRRPAEVVETARTREDPMIGFGVTTAEARTLVSMVALTGVAYPLSGVMPELPADRLILLQRTLPTMPIRPIDLFSRGTDIGWDTFKHTTADDYIHHYPEIVDLKVNAGSGVYDVVALPNWRSWAVKKSVSFREKLGLRPGTTCVAFDFWNQKCLGVFKDQISAEIEGHDTRVLLLHPVTDHPQLIGNSRHISGSYSISDLVWDGSTRVLRGTSETIPGKKYSLFIYFPETAVLAKVQATTTAGKEVPVHAESVASSLTISLEPPTERVTWEVRFDSTRGAK